MSFLGICLTLIAFAGVATNLIVLYKFGRTPKARKRHLFTLNLSFMGLLSSLSYGLACYYIFEGKDLIKYGCETEAFIISLLILGSILQLAVISIERCIVVWRPFLDKKILLSHKCIVIGIIYVISFAIACPPLLGWSSFKKVHQQFYCTLDFVGHDFGTRSYMILLLMCGYLFPTLAISVSYAIIFIVVRRSDGSCVRAGMSDDDYMAYSVSGHLKKQYFIPHRQTSSLLSENGETLSISLNEMSRRSRTPCMISVQLLNHERHRQVRIAILMMIVCGTFILCWTPIAILSVIWPFFSEVPPSPVLLTLGAMCGKMFVVINPLIYGFSGNMLCVRCRSSNNRKSPRESSREQSYLIH